MNQPLGFPSGHAFAFSAPNAHPQPPTISFHSFPVHRYPNLYWNISSEPQSMPSYQQQSPALHYYPSTGRSYPIITDSGLYMHTSTVTVHQHPPLPPPRPAPDSIRPSSFQKSQPDRSREVTSRPSAGPDRHTTDQHISLPPGRAASMLFQSSQPNASSPMRAQHATRQDYEPSAHLVLPPSGSSHPPCPSPVSLQVVNTGSNVNRGHQANNHSVRPQSGMANPPPTLNSSPVRPPSAKAGHLPNKDNHQKAQSSVPEQTHPFSQSHQPTAQASKPEKTLQVSQHYQRNKQPSGPKRIQYHSQPGSRDALSLLIDGHRFPRISTYEHCATRAEYGKALQRILDTSASREERNRAIVESWLQTLPNAPGLGKIRELLRKLSDIASSAEERQATQKQEMVEEREPRHLPTTPAELDRWSQFPKSPFGYNYIRVRDAPGAPWTRPKKEPVQVTNLSELPVYCPTKRLACHSPTRPIRNAKKRAVEKIKECIVVGKSFPGSHLRRRAS
ncbi:MAG: hypothetical protein M1831_005729 [Alyxoria varia]|nr:MAG: hypothetical protein M1831_005729 [Alyxoria varia]